VEILDCRSVGGIDRQQLPPSRDDRISIVSADQQKPNIAAIPRPHAIRNETWVAAVPIGAEPEERGVPVDVDPERPASAVIEDERAVSTTTHRLQTGQQFVVTLHITCAVKVQNLHATSASFAD